MLEILTSVKKKLKLDLALRGILEQFIVLPFSIKITLTIQLNRYNYFLFMLNSQDIKSDILRKGKRLEESHNLVFSDIDITHVADSSQ